MSCACGAEFNWDSAERVGGSSAAPPPTAPGARRVVGAEDIAALLPPAFPDTLAGVGLLPGGSARRPAQLGGATVSALDLELERARSRALQQELDRTRARLRQIGATAAAVTAVSPAAGPTPPPVFAPGGMLADTGLVVSNPTAGTAEAPPAPPPRRSKRAAAASSPGAPKKRR
jgi:hypothetical protein